MSEKLITGLNIFNTLYNANKRQNIPYPPELDEFSNPSFSEKTTEKKKEKVIQSLLESQPEDIDLSGPRKIGKQPPKEILGKDKHVVGKVDPKRLTKLLRKGAKIKKGSQALAAAFVAAQKAKAMENKARTKEARGVVNQAIGLSSGPSIGGLKKALQGYFQ